MMLSWIRKILRPPDHENEEDALAASLLHTILLIFAAAGFLVPLLLNLVAILDPSDEIPFEISTFLMGLIVPGLALGLMELMHRGRMQLASIIMSGTLFLLTTSTIITFRGTRDTASSMYILVIAMAGLLLGGRAAMIFTGLSLLATFGVYFAETNGLLDLTISDTPGIIEWIIFAIVLLMIGILLRFAFETLTNAFRQSREANQELESIQSSLADRVAARTKDLELAAEIGRYLSRVQESEGILLEAVELIRSRFDLYYTQIYLVDDVRNNLLLRAGTGLVGRQLRQLGHRLPINNSSINGTAALNEEPVIVSDTITSAIFRQNPLLPETRSEMAVPLIVSENVVGILNLQSTIPNSLTKENLPAFEALAGQLAVALDNARLFTEAAEAQGAVESLAQRLTRASWDSYLNAIDRQESIHYTYDSTQSKFTQDSFESNGNSSLSVPISLGGEALGKIEVQRMDWNFWNSEDEELLAAIGQRVAQQVENLRLLSETERYQSEAEEATRRLVRDGWETFIEEQANQIGGYSYDRQQVLPLPPEKNNGENETDLIQALTIRGESIGQFEIDGISNADEEVSELVGAVAERLSAHIENLRLTNQTEIALAETEEQAKRLALLTELGQALTRANTLEQVYEITASIAHHIVESDRTSIALLEADDAYYKILALGGEEGSSTVGERQPLEGSSVGVAIHENRLVVVNNSDNTGIPGIYSYMVAPLVTANNVIGTLNIGSATRISYDEQQERLLLQIASLLATTIESRRLFAEITQRAEELSVVNQVALVVSQMLELDELYSAVHEQVKRAIVSDAFFIAIYDEEENKINFPYLFDEGDQYFLEPIPSNPALEVVQVIESGEPILVNYENLEDVEKDVAPQALLATEKAPSSMIFVPLRSGLKPVGAISVQNYRFHQYTQADIDLLSSIAYHLAVALENARLFIETEQRAEELAVVNQIAQAVSGQIEQKELLTSVYDQIQRIIPVDAFSVTEFDPSTEMIHFLMVMDEGKQFNESPTPLGNGVASRVIREGRSILINRTAEDLEELAKGQQVIMIGNVQRFSASMVYVPLQIATKTIGAMSIQSYTLNAYGHAEVELLAHIANHVAIALENAHLFEQARARSEELVILNEMGRSLTALVDIDSILENVYRYTARLMDATNFYISFFDAKRNEITFALDVRGERVMRNAESRKAGKGLTEHIIHSKEPLLIPENVDDKLDELGIKKYGPSAASWLGVPILVGSQIIGVIGLQNWDVPRTYDEQHLRLLTSVAAQAAIAIENARLFEQIQARARRERILREVTAKVRGEADADTVMRTAVSEVGRALGRRAFVYLNQTEAQEAEVRKEDTYGD